MPEPAPPPTSTEDPVEAPESAAGGEVVPFHPSPEATPEIVVGTDPMPTGVELRDIAATAVTLARAGVIPDALRGKPNDLFAVLLTARDLGVALTTAIREFHVIKGRVTLSPKVRLAMVNQVGQTKGWEVWPDPGNNAEVATWHAIKNGRAHRFTLTMAEMQDVIDLETKKALVDKQNWKSYGRNMLKWRALGYLLDEVFPEVGTGIYSPDEMGAVTDEDGNYIDVDAVPAFDGMAGADRTASRDAMDSIAARIKALPDPARKELGEEWQRWDYPKIAQLRQSQVGGVNGLLDRIEAKVAAGGYPATAEPAETPAEPEGCPHPWPWEKKSRCVYCKACGERLYQGALPKDEAEAKKQLAALAEITRAAAEAVAQQVQEAKADDACDHPEDAQDEDPESGIKVCTQCGATI